tara:strand:+ start:5612 stop:6028 length:417 start_codon:yes stop_codon:yes gene_type:complete
MGWFSDLFQSAKTGLSDIYDTAKQTITNFSQGKFLAPGGYKYCGPGNALDEGEPKNASDSYCRQHDIDYSNFAKLKDQGKLGGSELKALVRESDDRLISSLQKEKERDLGSYLSEMGIRAKKFAEDWGILSPEQFVKA